MLLTVLSLLQHLVALDAGGWRVVRIGPPMLDLQDHALSAHASVTMPHFSLPTSSYQKPPGMESVEQLMSQAVSDNGLRLDHDTVTDGNCGPDAILRNLLRLQLTHAQARRIVQLFESRGRPAALQGLRLMLLIWIRDNVAMEIVPGTTLRDWILMEGFASLKDYILGEGYIRGGFVF